MNWATNKDSDETACAKLVAGLKQLNADLEVPSPTKLGHVKDDRMFALMASQALASGSPQNNPKVPTTDEIIQLYHEMW